MLLVVLILLFHVLFDDSLYASLELGAVAVLSLDVRLRLLDLSLQPLVLRLDPVQIFLRGLEFGRQVLKTRFVFLELLLHLLWIGDVADLLLQLIYFCLLLL